MGSHQNKANSRNSIHQSKQQDINQRKFIVFTQKFA
jgi:hypothetical protein